jgi:hypothetical protein
LAFGSVSGCAVEQQEEEGVGTVRVRRLLTLWRCVEKSLWDLVIELGRRGRWYCGQMVACECRGTKNRMTINNVGTRSLGKTLPVWG